MIEPHYDLTEALCTVALVKIAQRDRSLCKYLSHHFNQGLRQTPTERKGLDAVDRSWNSIGLCAESGKTSYQTDRTDLFSATFT